MRYAALVGMFLLAPSARAEGPPWLSPVGPPIVSQSYFSQRNDDVMRALVRFTPSRGPEEERNRVDYFRARDRLLLWQDSTALDPGDTALGVGLFVAAVVAAAHVPSPGRVIFDAPVHLGPSVSESTGVGAGLAWRF